METIQSILIAEFMNRGIQLHMVEHQLTGEYIPFNQMEYDSSWNWLMPVVEKIDGIGSSVIIGRFFCEIRYIDPLDDSRTFNTRIASGVKITAVFHACIQFIQWYNSQPQQP